jgi:hypothetical protein
METKGPEMQRSPGERIKRAFSGVLLAAAGALGLAVISKWLDPAAVQWFLISLAIAFTALGLRWSGWFSDHPDWEKKIPRIALVAFLIESSGFGAWAGYTTLNGTAGNSSTVTNKGEAAEQLPKKDERTEALSINFREQYQNGRFDISVRNDLKSNSLIDRVFVCDTDQWRLRSLDGRSIPRIPYAARQLVPHNSWEFASLMRVSVLSDELTLDCDSAHMKRLDIEVITGSISVPANGGVTILRVSPYPERWKLSRMEGKTARWNDQCPIQVVTDSGWFLLAPHCIDSREPRASLHTEETRDPVGPKWKRVPAPEDITR